MELDARRDGDRERLAHFGARSRSVAVRTRREIGPVARRGPLLVDEYDTTVVVPPGWTVRRDPSSQALVVEGKRSRG
jgi:N-methylhydantoinase A